MNVKFVGLFVFALGVAPVVAMAGDTPATTGLDEVFDAAVPENGGGLIPPAPSNAFQVRLERLEAELELLRQEQASAQQSDLVSTTVSSNTQPSYAPPANPQPYIATSPIQPSDVFCDSGCFGLDPWGSRMGGPAGMGAPAPPAIPGALPSNMPPPAFSTPLEAKWGTGPGFQLQTGDGQFTWQIHNLTQMDYRAQTHDAKVPTGTPPNVPGASGPNNEFTFPRVWLITNGTLAKNWDWMLAPSFQFDNVNLLDAWINAHYDDRFQLKAGRYKTPFTYEFYAEPIQGLIQPERSLFFNNFGLNRQVGVMAHGTVLDRQVDYAIGVYNGQRNAFLANQNSKDVAGYFNYRPFMYADLESLRRFDVGFSFDVGDQNNGFNAFGTPTVLRTSVASTGNLLNGVEFLQFAPAVREQGLRALGSVHAAYYYQQLSMIAEVQGGGEHYTHTGTGVNAHVPIRSWYVQAGYFLTGETTTYRNVVKPDCPFTAHGGTGAIELTGRYNELDLGNQVYTAGLVDAAGGNVWTNRVDMMDLGVNWYPNQWLKISTNWEHCWFGSPVTYRPGLTQRNNDMLFIRTQIWF